MPGDEPGGVLVVPLTRQAHHVDARGGFRDETALREAWAAISIDLSVDQCRWLETGDTLA